jgi:hypothetical protein
MTKIHQMMVELCGEIDVNRRLVIREILAKSRTTGSLLLSESFPLDNTETLWHLFTSLSELGFYEQKCFRSLVRGMNPSVVSLSSSINLLDALSVVGFSDDTFLSAIFANTIKAFPLEEMNPRDLFLLLRMMQKHRYRHVTLIEYVANCLLGASNIEIGMKFKTVRLLAELNLLDISHVRKCPTTLDPTHCVDIMWAVLLHETHLKKPSALVELLPMYLKTLANAQLSSADFTTGLPPSMVHKLQIIRDALFYVYHDSIYIDLSDSVKSFLSRFNTGDACETSLVWRKQRIGLIQLSDVLFSNNVAHSVKSKIGAFVVDIVERDRKIIWEFDTRERFYNDGTGQSKASYFALRNLVLGRMGYKVINVPYWQWSKLRTKKVRKDYCRTNRYLSIADMRDATEVDADPRCWTAEESLHPVNEFQNEYIYRKQSPKQAWCWQKPVLPLRVTV